MYLKLLCLILCTKVFNIYCADKCLNVEVGVTQNIENEGFHRKINWIIELFQPTIEKWVSTNCKLSLRLDVSNGMFVDPDEIAELNKTAQFGIYIDGKVDIEKPAHEAAPHIVTLFLNNERIDRTVIDLPIHMRYQRAQITGGVGKVYFQKPSILAWCPKGSPPICSRGLRVEGLCSMTGRKMCVWKNISYISHFDDLELFIPVGDLDDYPIVSIVTLLLGCAGCVYVLSILSTSPL